MKHKHIISTAAVLLFLIAFAVAGTAQTSAAQTMDEDWMQDAFDHPVFQDDWDPFEYAGLSLIEPEETEVDEIEVDEEEQADETEEDTTDTDPSQEDIEAAQQASEEADACTAEFAEMQSPHDSDVTFDATDGCMIAELEDRGWERVDTSTGIDDFDGFIGTDGADEIDGTDGFDSIDDTGDESDETDDGTDGFDSIDDTGDESDETDDVGTTVSEEAYIDPVPEPGDAYYEAGTDDWVSYINPRDEYRSPSLGDGSGKMCVTLLNEDGEHIIGDSISGTQVSIPTGESVNWHTRADPFTVNFPMDEYYTQPLDADQFGTTPELPQGDGYLDSHCMEWHGLADDATVSYGEATITGDHANDVEVVGYIQQPHEAWDTNVDPIADAESYEAAGGGWTMYPGGSHGQVVVVLQLTG